MTLLQNDIVNGLKALGLKSGNKVLVHSSLSSFGYIEGGANTVIDALLETVGDAGTLLVPTLTGYESLSVDNPPVFDPIESASWTGIIPETLRKRSEAIRSLHPTHSVAAIGKEAAILTRDHIDSITPCDALSPYGKLAALDDGYILLIGVTHQSNTTMHHVEEIVGVDYHMQPGFVEAEMIIDGATFVRRYMLHAYGNPRDFNVMESVFVERGIQKNGQIGDSTLRLIKSKMMVETTLQAIKADKRILCEK